MEQLDSKSIKEKLLEDLIKQMIRKELGKDEPATCCPDCGAELDDQTGECPDCAAKDPKKQDNVGVIIAELKKKV